MKGHSIKYDIENLNNLISISYSDFSEWRNNQSMRESLCTLTMEVFTTGTTKEKYYTKGKITRKMIFPFESIYR